MMQVRFPSWFRIAAKRRAAKLVVAGDRARDRGDWAAAGLNYRAALDVNPGLVHIWVQYGHALKETGELRGAETAYRTAIERDAEAADPYLQLGHVLKLQDRISEAAEAYFNALKRDPKLRFPRAELLALGYSANELDQKIGAAPTAPEIRFHPGGVPIDLGLSNELVARRVAALVGSRSAEPPSAYPSFCILELNRRSVIGWAFLPLEIHHAPIVNVYRHGQLVAAGLSNCKRPESLTEGPKYNWFEIRWGNWGFLPSEAELSELVFQRGEDGRLCANPFKHRDQHGSARLRVVDLLGAEAYDIEANKPFKSQLTDLSALATIHLYYLDYLGRPVDPQGLDTYLEGLGKDRLSVDGLREKLLRSDEFRLRGVRVSDRLGQTAGVDFLSIYPEMAFDRSPPLRTYETLSADMFSTKDDDEFWRLCCSQILGGTPDAAENPALHAALDRQRVSRLDVLREMVLDAAVAGRFVKIDNPARLVIGQDCIGSSATAINSVDEFFGLATPQLPAHAERDVRASLI